MGTTIFYFTGTGNSLMVARGLAEELGGVRLISIAKAMREPVPDLTGECVGLVYPVHFGSNPLIVRDFIRTLPLERAQYVFAVVHCGGMSGGTLDDLARLLQERGADLAAGFQLKLPDNYILMFNPPDSTLLEKRIHQGKMRVKAIASLIAAKQRTGIEEDPLAPLVRLLLPAYQRLIGMETDSKRTDMINRMGRRLRVKDNCTGCGVCRSVCPVANIEMAEGKPKWGTHCQLCLACINWCPEKAIEYGNKTTRRGRYTNPSIAIKDIIAANGAQPPAET